MHSYGLGALIQALLTGLVWASTSVERAPPGTSSLTFVFDTTGSMNDDLIQVQDGARKILDTVLKQREKLIYNYVYVPFHDPRVGPVFSTTDSTAFQRHLNSVHVVGGGDCPEMTLSGIQLALETALPTSFIYVFTDARSKDYHLEDQILNLIQEKQSSVVFVMTGDCNDRTHPGFRTYEKIAAASFGQVFHLEKTDVKKVLNYVRHSVALKKVHLMYEVRERGGTNLRLIPVDQHLNELTLSLSGDKDDGDFLDISLTDPKGTKVERAHFSNESGTIDLNNIKLIRITNPLPGIWRVRTSSRLKHVLRVLGHGAIDFKYGFSTRPIDRIELAHPRPISHQTSYLLVNMTGLPPPGTVFEISLVDYFGKELFSKPATINKRNPYLYFMGPFVPPKGLFFVRVKGEDDKSYEFLRIAPTATSSVQAGGPRAYMADRTAAVAGESVNLTCSIASRTDFTLYWYKGQEKIGGPLFYPFSDTAVWTLKEVTAQDRGDYSCVVVSDSGNHTASTFLETREPVPEITSIRNESVAVGMTAYLHCLTQNTNPTIQWMRGNSVIRNTDRTRLFQNGTLMIPKVTLQDGGAYRCRVQTAGGTTEATLHLKILELPRAAVYPTSLFFVRGQSFNISCHVTGDPKPEPQWYFRGNLIKPDHRKYYITYKYDLIVHRPFELDAGVYECRAHNQAGYHVDSAVAQMAIKPKVKVTRDRQMIGRGDRVTLECQVLEGNPKPKVTWYRRGREVPSYRYIQIDGGRLTIQGVQDSDAGSYTCVAQNIAGRDFGNMNLDVGSLPTIVPTPETVRVNIERSTTLQCRAIGHPVPEITWQRHGVPIHTMGNRVKTLPDGSLLINNAQMDDQDRYTCTAKNMFGQQDKTTVLMVTGLVSPVLGHVPPEEQLIEGKDLRLSCVVVLGTPKPTLKWFKDGVPLEPSDTVIIEGGGSGLLLRKGNRRDEGRYTCAAISPAGNATLNINVQLIRKPVIESTGIQQYVISLGRSVDIPCRVLGKPPPQITWSVDGKPLSTSGPEHMILPDNTLRIHRVNSNHAGQYVCTAINQAGESEWATSINVLSAPTIAPGQVSYNLIQGNSITLPCEVKGEPAPKIAWYLNEKLFKDGIINEDGSLTILNASESHRGHFKCVAENEVGSDERIIILTVHTAPTIEGSGQVKTFVTNVNQTAVLPCPARAQPPPTRTWSYEGDRLFPGYAHGSEIRFPSDGSIQIVTPQMNHAGKYTCHVSNLAGDDHITYLLKIQEPPLIISDIPDAIDVIHGMMLEIPCRAVGTPDPTVTWEKDGFPIISDEVMGIDASGTLHIDVAQSFHQGEYQCVASNPAGKDQRRTVISVQEPPVISPTTLSDYTTVEGDRIEMRCLANANPPPVITWSRKGIPVSEDMVGIHVTEDGTLVIENVVNDDAGHYTCKASNAAGDADKVIRLSVIIPPDIPDQDTIVSEAVVVGQPFSLYCPVFSTPLPQISWHLDDHPVADGDPNIQLSDDKRHLHVLRSRPTDTGNYKCVARNPAGESSKSFQVEILVPPSTDESLYKLKLSVLENNTIEIACPVNGVPSPDISWLANGQLLQEGHAKRGVRLAAGGQAILIDSAQLYHEGIYTCVAVNKAGSLDIDVHLTVLAPPKVGNDEELEVTVGKGITMNCDVEQEGPQSTITWLFNGSENLPPNAQVVLHGRRLYVDETSLLNQGLYQCRVRNTAGESIKNFKLRVIAPPEFVEKEYMDNIQITTGIALTLTCYVNGNPQPTIRWLRDGRDIHDKSAAFSDSNQKLIIQHTTNANHRYACLANNKAGTASREFTVQIIAPPEINESGDRTVIDVMEGHSVTLECPVSAPFGVVDIEWIKHGRPITPDDINSQISLDRTRLVLMNVQKSDEATFTCVAKNSAGQAAREFQVNVLVPPRIVGKMVEDMVVVEGESLELECDFDADPIPEIFWVKDTAPLSRKVQLLNEKRSALVAPASAEDAGAYRCTVRNKAGQAEKTFNVRVILKPELIGSGETSNVETLLTHPVTLECPIASPIGVELMWTKDELPIISGNENIQILSGGRHLLISSVTPADEAVYTCVARNAAGQDRKSFKLSVLVPASVVSVGGEYKVIENNSLVLPCEAEGYPPPQITWTKDGRSALSLPQVQTLSGGQQLKIAYADVQHRGSYMCAAVNKVGRAEINFDVEVITRPVVAQAAREVIEVIKNESAVFKCPIKDRRFIGQISWLKDLEPINMRSSKYALSHSNRKLHMLHAELRDEGSYSCRVKNAAGESHVDYKLVVLVPPEIIMLDKNKNKTVTENDVILLSCPATGKPEPTIDWYKDGELLTQQNITRRLRSGRLEGNDLRIARVEVSDGGRFTCEAKNKAGMAEQDVLLTVMTPPRIEREGVPSEIGGKSKSTVTISCPAYGRPMPTVTWLKAGRPLDYSQDVYLSANGMKLHFLDLKKIHADRYTCIARNPAGEDKRDFLLKLLEAPTIEGPNILRKVQVNAGRTSIINCPVMGSPEPSIAWLKNGQPFVPDSRHVFLNGGRQLQIGNTTISDDARYTCIATNDIGLADLETYLQVIGGPTIAGSKLESAEVLLNEPYDLDCDVSGTEPMDIEWLRGGQKIDFGGIRGGNSYLQVSARGRRLHILSAQAADTDRFTCFARNSAGEARKSYDLKVLVRPTINESTSSLPLQTIIPGTAFAVECKVEAIPDAEIIWRLNDRAIVSDESVVLLNNNQTLWVNRASDKFGGRYTCHARNKVGYATRDFLVQLTAPPVLDSGSQQLDINVGDFTVLTCEIVSGTGTLSVKWLVDGKAVRNGPVSPTVTVSDRRIEIRNARLSDSGSYVCIAENEAGQARKKFDVAVLERPRFLDMTNLSPSIIVGRPLVLDCSVTGTPKPTVVWLKDGKQINNSDILLLNDRQQLHIESATEEDAGRYSCVAENKPGRVEKDLIVAVLKPPLMEDYQRSFEVPENDTHTLICPINDPSVGIQWSKNGVPITTSNNLQLSTSGHKLHIMRGQVTDGGRYTCRAWNEAGEATSSMDVIILVAPKIAGPPFQTIDAVLNQTVQMECKASGTPSPDITWSLGGKTIFPSEKTQVLQNGTVLRLLGVQSSQEGRYSCTASNKVGRAEADTFLQITAPPRIITPSDELKVIAGHGQTIRCEVSGTPSPRVEWLKNNKKFDAAMAQASSNLHYIHFREAQIEDAGRYTCIATNRAGERRMSTELHVLVAPQILEGERIVQVKENTTLTLECQASGNPTPKIIWKRDGVVVNSAQGARLVIQSTTASDAGRFTCEATNEAGKAVADFEVDVFIKPRFRDLKSDIRVRNGERTRLECKVDGHPLPAVTWLRGGRSIDDMKNLILSPRGETLMILKAKRADAGSYSCVAKNLAGESEASFTVTVLTRPHIDEQIDQTPKVVQNHDITLQCPIRGNPKPKIQWLMNGQFIRSDRFTPTADGGLSIKSVQEADAGRYTCVAQNEAGSLNTDYELEVIGPPRFHREGDAVYEVRESETVTMDCAVDADPKPEIIWYRGDSPLYLSDNIHISSDGQQITIRGAQVSDGGKYTCRATNEAGSADIDLTLKILIPPSIDKSNIIGNPLAIVGRSIYLECPVTGIPQPKVTWFKEGNPIDVRDQRILVDQNNQTFGILHVETKDEGRYYCVAENRGGKSEQEFNLEVVVPPQMETTELQRFTKREQDTLTLWCPVKNPPDSAAMTEIFWYKDGRPIDAKSGPNVKISSDGRRLQLTRTTLADAGNYSCIALNRAGESSLEFDVEILSAPKVDGSRNDAHPHVAVGRPITIWCIASGHPFPIIKWLKDGKVENGNTDDAVRILENGQALEIISAKAEHSGIWTCEAENDAGKTELEFNLDVWTPPIVKIDSDNTIRALDSSITLHCHASGNPQPTLSWSMAGQPLMSSAEGARISLKGTRLDIPRLKQSHVGDYTCSARNDAGSAEASIHVDVLVPPVISRDNVEMSPRLPTGQTLTLLCDASGKPFPELDWYINGTVVQESSGNLIMGEDGRYLQINNISLADRGVYRCVARNVAGRDELLYNVAIVQAPIILNGGTQQVIEGEVAKITCNAYGEPIPVITWQRNGVRVETGMRYIAEDKILTVIETRSSDSGIYVCVATNEAGTTQQAFTLEVLVSPRIVTTSPNESVVPINNPFSLKCGARGYPYPEITWTIDDQPVEEELKGRFSIADDGTLFIEKVAKKAVHTFKCTATNDAGTDEKEYMVKLISPPFVTKEGLKTINSTEGDPSLLVCEIEGHVPRIYWFKDGVPIKASANIELMHENTQLKIHETRLHDEGLYSCVAMNPAGNATQKQQLYVGVPPRITEKPRRIIVKSGQPAELWCEAVGIPQPQISWLKDDMALPQTALDDKSETLKSTAIFANVSSKDAGVYTCKAQNWAGTSYKDVDLVVLIPPTIHPEMVNYTANLKESIVIPCNATGIPEPVVSWVKMPNIDIVANDEKYRILGTSLGIRNIAPEDDGFYHCIAKSNAGQAIGSRRVTVKLPIKDYKVIWVECDEMGNPVKTTYVPARGDMPEDGTNLLPWKQDYQDLPKNGTNGILIRCLPGVRGPRRVPIATAPHFTYSPRSQTVRLGSTVYLHCSAYGPPMPEIVWLKNGDRLAHEQSVEGHSTLRIDVHDTSASGTYVCMAQNVVGASRTQARITVDSNGPNSTEKRENIQHIALLTCFENGIPQREGVTWAIHGDQLNKDDEKIHLMNNGSLVIFDANNVSPVDLLSYECYVYDRLRKADLEYMDVVDGVPKVVVHQNKMYTRPGDDIIVDCQLQSQPLTTKLQWTKNDVPLAIDERIRILPNNSLQIKNLRLSDRASYKCRVSNKHGKSWDGLDVIVQDGPSSVVGFIDGTVNNEPITNQALYMNVTPEVYDNEVYIKIDNLVENYDPATGAMLSYMSAPCKEFAYDPGQRNKPLNSAKFEKLTDYRFDSGERMHVKQKGRALDGSYLQMDVLFDGHLPKAKNDNSVSLDDTVEEMVEEAPGLIRGHGHSVLQLGKHTRIPFQWNHSISYDASKGMSIGPGKTLKMNVKSNHLTSDQGYKIAAKASRTSKCPQGYETINGFCEDIDECASNPNICGDEAICVNNDGGFNCERECPAGYKVKWDGSCKDIDECSLGLHNCTRGTQCTNTKGGFKCDTECLDGYFLNKNGECEDIDECATSSPCDEELECLNQMGSYSCLCPSGFPADEDGICEGYSNEDDLSSRTLSYDDEDEEQHGCPFGYQWNGKICEDINECAFESPCQYECHNLPGSYECECPDGYEVDEGDCIDIDECADEPCTDEELCFNKLGTFECIADPCPVGYYLDISQCVPNCLNCSLKPITIHMLSVPSGLKIGTSMLRLTAYDSQSRVLHRTRFHLKSSGKYFRRAPFTLKNEGGRAVLQTVKPLVPNSSHRLTVRSISRSPFTKRKYHSDFIVFISVSDHPF